jgi:hypothetical protein
MVSKTPTCREEARFDAMPLRPLYPTDTERHISIVKLFVQKRYLKRRRRRRLRVNNEIEKMVVDFKHQSRSFYQLSGTHECQKFT